MTIALEVRNLKKVYSSKIALNGINFRVNQGELFSLLGPNGAGKTTTLRILSGLATPTSGDIFIFGQSLHKKELSLKREIGLVPQHTNLDLELTVEENLLIHGLLYHMPMKEIKAKLSELLEFANLKERRKSKVKELSGGLKKRLLIIRALFHSPKILLMDEPTVGLDPHIRRKLWNFIKQIQSKGTTILLTTHYMEEAEILSDKVAFISQGNILRIDTPANFIKSLGEIALDVFTKEGINTYYFKDNREAERMLLKYTKENYYVSLRKTNLEDAFITLTGKE